MSSNLTLRQAVNMAVGAASAAVATVGFAPLAFAQSAPAASSDMGPDSTLQEVVVTGSRIRRVDAETANAITLIDHTAIQDSGIQTVGELLQRLPSISGSATTGATNNGGGFGEATVELRGLDARRTLILVDGRRQGIVGDSDAPDVNQIPISLIDHVEVLKEGAGAIYGSDAVGGVVNFITRKDVDGVEFGGSYGRTGKNDGEQHGANLIFGKNTDTFHITAGADYNDQKAVYAGGREYSKFARYLYGGTTGGFLGGSSRTPTGRINLPAGLLAGYPDATGAPCDSGSVTRIGPGNGQGGAAGTAPGDYRCFISPGDKYNYQPFNLLMTPQERTHLFFRVADDINDYATVYSNFTYAHTHSGSEQAALPFDAQADDVIISKNNIYNPFGIDFGGLTSGNENVSYRLSGFGDRVFKADTDSEVGNIGVKGKTGFKDWTYDANIGYSRQVQQVSKAGYYLKSALTNAVGPSFIAADGTPTCGTVAVPIDNCVPLNIFNTFTAASQAVVRTLAATVVDTNVATYKSAEFDFNGTVIPLPAGDMKAAVGFSYHDTAGDFTPSTLAIASPPLYLKCLVSNEACTGPVNGNYNSKDEYIELFIPILKDLPLVNSLNLDAGVRHSDYSLFGSTTKSELKIEYRPIKDLLLRGTWAQVFRVPTINDLFAAPVNTSITFNDPCNGLTAAKVAANANLALACQGVALDGTFKEPNGQVTGLNLANAALKPEVGIVKTAGFVYDPSFLSGFSVDVDYWSYSLKNVITELDGNYTAQQCVTTGNPTFCSLLNRYTSGASSGQILVLSNPTSNLGALKTNGVDLGIHYALRNTPVGNFNFGVDFTDTMSYLSTAAPGAPAIQVAGTFNKQYGNYAKLRGLGSAAWSGFGAEALISAQYIDKLRVTSPAASGVEADGVTPYPDLKIGSVVYWNASLGYTFVSKTKVLVSIQNMFDKLPPIYYQNNVVNANTDVSTYDTLGRRWLVSFVQKF